MRYSINSRVKVGALLQSNCRQGICPTTDVKTVCVVTHLPALFPVEELKGTALRLKGLVLEALLIPCTDHWGANWQQSLTLPSAFGCMSIHMKLTDLSYTFHLTDWFF